MSKTHRFLFSLIFSALIVLTTPALASEPINLNSADIATLATLKGIGDSKARAIFAYREKNGPFKSVDDLSKVKGIGDKMVAKLRDQIRLK